MGPVRHRRLINWLSMAVALQLSVALVALAGRAGRDIDPRAETEFSVGQAQNGSILAGARIPKRQGAKRPETSPGPSSSVTTGPAAGAAPAPAAEASPGGPPAVGPAPGPPQGKSPPATTPRRPTTAASRPQSTTTTRPASAAVAATPAAAGDRGQPGTLVDPSGDTVVDGSGEPASDPRADIVRAGAVSTPENVTFAVQVQRPSDPRSDERWVSDSTYAQWEVDTNGDAMPDFEIQYYFVDEDNLGGSVSKPGDGGAPVCEARVVTYSADGYKVTVDPACLGNPASFSYRAALYYDTDPADEDAAVVTDVAPNGGWSAPIARLS